MLNLLKNEPESETHSRIYQNIVCFIRKHTWILPEQQTKMFDKKLLCKLSLRVGITLKGARCGILIKVLF